MPDVYAQIPTLWGARPQILRERLSTPPVMIVRIYPPFLFLCRCPTPLPRLVSFACEKCTNSCAQQRFCNDSPSVVWVADCIQCLWPEVSFFASVYVPCGSLLQLFGTSLLWTLYSPRRSTLTAYNQNPPLRDTPRSCFRLFVYLLRVANFISFGFISPGFTGSLGTLYIAGGHTSTLAQ